VAAKKGQRRKQGKKTKKQWEAIGAAVDMRLIKGLGHPLRIAILTLLNDRMASPNELAKELDEGLSQISYHVKVLRDYELIELVKTEPRRGAVEHYYKAVDEVLLPASQIKLMPKSAQRTAFGGVLSELEQDLNSALETGTFDKRPDWVVARDPRPIDNQAREEAEEAAAEFFAKYKDIRVDATKRIAKGESEAVPTTVALLIFGSTRGLPKKRRRS
jgi:DNA-binding transcriptional ArsR family regulator